MCDAAYLCQVEQLERAVLSQVVLMPHLEEADRKKMQTVDEARAEFDAWLIEEPEQQQLLTAEDRETAMLYRLLGVGKGR